MVKQRFIVSLSLTESENIELEALRNEGKTNIFIFRLGLQSARDGQILHASETVVSEPSA